jgi:hypothetical protein
MDRKSCLTLLAICLTMVFISFVCVLLYWYVPRSKVYYIPQKQIYVKVIERVANQKLDIILGDNSKLSKSKKYDNFQFYKHLGGNFIISPNENTLYFDYEIVQRYDNNGKMYMDTIIPDYHLHSVKYTMIDGILHGDTLFYEKKDKFGISKLKTKYIGIIIRGRNCVLLKASEDSVYKRIKPTTGKYADNENARVIDTYNLLNNNCVTVSIDGVQSGSAQDLKLGDLKGPMAVRDVLNVQSGKKESNVIKITPEVIKKELKLPNE